MATSIIPALVGLIPTFLIRISEPGTREAAAMKYAADEISPGTWILRASSSSQVRVRACHPSSFSKDSTSAPKARREKNTAELMEKGYSIQATAAAVRQLYFS